MRSSTHWPWLLAGLALAGCRVDAAFSCQDDASCEGVGPAGQCEPSGYCSFEDPECDGGRRYGTLAGEGLGGSCVGELEGTGSTGAPATGGPTSGEGGSSSSTSGVDETGPIPVDWWDCQWAARRRLTIDPGGLGEDLSSVPVLIVLDPTRIDPSIMDPGGIDLRFVTEDGASLPYEIEQWSPTGLSWVWVGLPRLGPSGESIDMYYGNREAPLVDASGLWSEFVGVWHMGFELADATGFNVVEQAQTMTGPGQAASAQQYTASSDGVRLLHAPPLDEFFAGGATISAMIRPASWGNSGRGPIVSRAGDSYGDAGWAFQVHSREALRFCRGFSGERGSWYTPDESIALHRWHHVAVVYEDLGLGSIPRMFIDGVEQPIEEVSTPAGTPVDYSDEALLIGGDPSSTSRWFRGSLDEIRMSPTPRSAGWMAVQAASMRDDLVVYGPPESSPCTEPAP